MILILPIFYPQWHATFVANCIAAPELALAKDR